MCAERETPRKKKTKPLGVEPCKEFSKMPCTKEFLAHLPTCEKCRAVLDAFDRDFENDSHALRQMFAFPD